LRKVWIFTATISAMKVPNGTRPEDGNRLVLIREALVLDPRSWISNHDINHHRDDLLMDCRGMILQSMMSQRTRFCSPSFLAPPIPLFFSFAEVSFFGRFNLHWLQHDLERVYSLP
jgi:hypothetical protein